MFSLSFISRTLWVAALCAVIVVGASPLLLWDKHGIHLLGRIGVGLLASLCIGALAAYVSKGRKLDPIILAVGISACMVLILSDWMTRSYGLYPAPAVRGEILLFTIGAAFLLSRGLTTATITAYAVVTPLALILLFLLRSDGNLIFSDDHTVFFFRLSMLREMFPSIPFYYPGWNAGFDARDFFATGSLNVFFLSAPLLYLTDLTWSYNLIASLLIFALPAAASYYAATVLRLERPAPAIAAVLALAISLTWYRWALKYGTMGFLTSTALTPILVAWAIRLYYTPSDITKREGAIIVAATSLVLMWSLSGVALIPLALWALVRIRALLAQRVIRLVFAGVLLVNVPWIIAFISVSKVFDFVAPSRKIEVPLREVKSLPSITESPSPPSTKTSPVHIRGKPKPITSDSILKHIRESAVSTHPLLLSLAIPGIFLLSKGRWILASLAVWLLFLGAVLPEWKPQLELERMLQILLMILVTPTALALATLIRYGELHGARWYVRIGCALPVGLFLVSPFVVANIIENRSLERYYFASKSVEEVTHTIRQHGGAGRTLFSGFVLHELSQGHLAPLTLLTGKPLVASSQLHNVWRYTNVIPPSFMARKEEGIEEYLSLLNVTAVAAHEPQWIKYFTSHREIYTRVASAGKFTFFTRKHASSYTIEGDAMINAVTTSSVEVTPRSADVTLSFQYFPFLVAEGCEVTPKEYGELSLVRLSNCTPGRTVSLRSIPAWKRVLQGRN